ncbi:probable LRR receptor-like serine/threonine-protein kinase At3g47570 [Malus sylvestris]|uniref:probable LRR receptor-like serine/threonine-protein kinase At3g47570 n=1 Tax=Malus domestica TaxID=3750 RepID=UPI0004989ECC|nr:probable LRR receptor-like serine/threonine-protein kinase At3g47570 [Malus domestica]XP_008385915.1 probable LRR receptor-like serine/threonine-protein kinase At3g47570 [Malus domestica]XP_050145159.1 probable LRR receptor-like serine/threonine-protein kinase At3g47570 [Malus sylvestris]XP_050145160.1 probable LRR receptor-like serine/threonine-protein kinase At3g47570 [Malus sylvestris]
MMEHSCTNRRRVLFMLLHGFILLCIITCLESAALRNLTLLGNESDRLALLDFKKRITADPFDVMSSWNHSIHFCSWVGVSCQRSTKRVLILNLKSQKLVGSIPPSVGNLTYLIGINLIGNNFHGEIPPEMGRLQSLQYLNLSHNSFRGKIPTNLSQCTHLRLLNLESNQIKGSIPNQLSSLLNLKDLSLYGNNLTGTIPPWIGNFSLLSSLYLGNNNFQGRIPNELGHITGLEEFVVELNNLFGMVPSSIYNISSINVFSVVGNQLHGELPPNLGTMLPNLVHLYYGGNKFRGNIPISLSNASRLQALDLSQNAFSGTVPGESLGNLRSLFVLNFEVNRLGNGKTGGLTFLSFLANCTSLKILGLLNNNFGGGIPGSIANLSTQLSYLSLGGNFIHGKLPCGIGNLINLTTLSVEDNHLGGSVPHEIGKLGKLEQLYLDNNKFSGSMPSSLGNLTSLLNLYMELNRFEGSIPPSLGNCQNLLDLNLSSNNLTGTIPKMLMELSTLSISLDLSNNYLIGLLPFEVGDLVHLTKLNVLRNNLSGAIPNSLGSCTSLEHLYLQGNKFEGTIPQTLKDLKGLEKLDISSNNLSGQIPEFIGKLGALKYFNISYNDFEGELPKEGIFANVSGVSVLGNHRLCGGIPQLYLPPCPPRKHHSSRGLHKVIIPISCALAFIIALSCFFGACSMLKKSRYRLFTSCSYKDWKSGVSYSQLAESTNGFSVDNIIGSGSFGYVYKGVIPSDGTIVAVKVLNLQQQGASKSFIDECKALRSIRHRNLLKIITACSSIDNQGKDFKSLVFEFMANGSLDSWLYPREDDQSLSKRLSFIQRLDIAIGVASALDYLHHHCETAIVHCDLKSSNVLLDEDMVAHVGDFGLARFLFEPPNDPAFSQTMSSQLKGSIGYIPPEYGMGGQVSTLGDVYSYGILLLEIFTGKRPIDDIFKGELTIYQFVAMALPDHVMDVVDPSIVLDLEADSDVNHDIVRDQAPFRCNNRGQVKAKKLKECLASVMHIGLSCSVMSPRERMLMDVVVRKMSKIRDSYL